MEGGKKKPVLRLREYPIDSTMGSGGRVDV